MTSFADLGLRAELVAALAAAGINEPFPIQEATIRDSLAGRDTCGRAKTGSGKTLAFGLPMLQRVPADVEPVIELPEPPQRGGFRCNVVRLWRLVRVVVRHR